MEGRKASEKDAKMKDKGKKIEKENREKSVNLVWNKRASLGGYGERQKVQRPFIHFS